MDADADRDYYKDRVQIQENSRKLLNSNFVEKFRVRLSAPGTSAEAAATAVIKEINGERAAAGQPLLTQEEERRLRADGLRRIGEIAPQRVPPSVPGQLPPGDPMAATQYLQSVSNQSVYDINVQEARQRMAAIQQAGLPEGQEGLFTQVTTRINKAEEAQRAAKTWQGEYNTDLDKRIDDLIGDDSQAPGFPLYGLLRTNAADRIKGEVVKRMSAKLKELSQGQPLSQEQITGELRSVWGDIQKEIIDGQFKLEGYGGTPAPNGTVPSPLKPEVKPGSENKPQMEPGVELNQLNNMPRRNNRLANWRNGPSPILSGNALIQVIRDAASGRKENSDFTKAWKRSGAPNAWSFIERQMQFYKNLGGGKGWTDEQLQRAKQDLLSVLVRDANRATTAQLMQTSPTFALLNNWAEMV